MAKKISKQWRLPDVIWEYMEPLLPQTKKQYTTGRPRSNLRNIADGIFYVLRTGCQWKAVPREFGSGSTIHEYFQSWALDGVFWKLWQQGLLEYDELSLSEIAFQLNYSSVAYLSNQFKKVTGLTPSYFKQLKVKKRKPLDKV